MTFKVYVPDIECDSCVKLIKKKLDANHVTSYTVNKDSIDVHESSTKEAEVVNVVKGLGFRASLEPFDRKSLKERQRHFKENKHKYQIEMRALKYFAGIFAVLLAVSIFAYFVLFKGIPGFLPTYGWWLFYLIITITVLAAGLWHFLAYRAKFTCMTGMMVGMTFGMQTGMMLGVVVGATNGFFVGAMAGMLLGVLVGALTGRCCGVMGVMEGMMAGVMGGTMGPMISVMMFSDNLLWFMPFYIIINVAIIAGLSYMLYEEVVENNEAVEQRPLDFVTLASLSVIVLFILVAIMLYGPRSALLGL